MKNKYAGFTLVELLVTIAIIGILAGILIPTVTGALQNTRRVAAMTNAITIADAHHTYLMDRGKSLLPDQIKSTGDFAALMAQYGYLETAENFFAEDDPLGPDPIPRSLAIKGADGWKPSEQFMSVDAYSVDIAVGISTHGPMGTTPFLWSRGLTTGGNWSEDGGVWGAEEGFVIFTDGHAERMQNAGEGDGSKFVHYENRTPTTNVLEALPGRAVVRGKGTGSLDGQSGAGSN